MSDLIESNFDEPPSDPQTRKRMLLVQKMRSRLKERVQKEIENPGSTAVK